MSSGADQTPAHDHGGLGPRVSLVGDYFDATGGGAQRAHLAAQAACTELFGRGGKSAHHFQRIDHMGAFRKPQAGRAFDTRCPPCGFDYFCRRRSGGDVELFHEQGL